MKTIVLIDTNSGRGHHLTYLRLFSKVLLELRHRVIVFYPEPDDVTNWVLINLSSYAKHFYAFKMCKLNRRRLPGIGVEPEPIAIIQRWKHAAKNIKIASQRLGVSVDLVFFNWLDNYFSHYLTHHIIDQVFPYKWSGIYFRPGQLRFGRYTLPILNIPLAHYAIAKSLYCQSLAMLNEEMVETVRREINNSVIAFPDITDESAPDSDQKIVHDIKKKAGNKKIIGLIGSLSKRKGLLTLLKVAQQSIDKGWFFLFAGPLLEEYFHQDYDQKLPEQFFELQRLIQSPPDNCFFYLNHIPDGVEYNSFVDICDILFAAYENFPYSSNMLTKAAVFKKSVIVTDGFCMAQRVKKFQLGVCISEGDIAGCIKALEILSDRASHFKGIVPDFASYHRLHSVEQVRTVFQTILDISDSKLIEVKN